MYGGVMCLVIGILLWLIPVLFPGWCIFWCSASTAPSMTAVVDETAIAYASTPTQTTQRAETVVEPPRTLVRFNGNCEGQGRIVGVDVTASNYAPQSQDDGGSPTFYYPYHTLDCRSDTSWRTPYLYDNPWLQYTFAQPVVLQQVILKPGYDKNDPYTGRSRWNQNWRVRSVRFDVALANGSVCTFDWFDIPDEQRMQPYDLSSCVGTQEAWQLTMTILDARPPIDSDPREFVAISDMMFEGYTYDQ
jgi:hypothetical protein